ncbi:MAG: response regulator transcription factor [Lachnospiraceae bacterium]|nr:response regulator transcription factor [Lachnospiraceae bacterium]
MKIAIVDDEENWRRNIYKKLKTYFQNADIEMFSSGDVFIEKQEVYDIVLLDIKMEGRDGFETAREYALYGEDSVVIILTTHSELVKRGYEVSAFRYLDKVNLDEELPEAVAAVKKLFAKNKTVYIPIVNEGEKVFELKEIVYAETEKRNIRIYTVKRDFLSNIGMTELEKLLGNAFFRCHRSYIVNLDMIKQINRIDVTLRTGKNIMVSKRKLTDLKKRYLNWRFEYANA